MRYSLFSLVRNAFAGPKVWPPAWQSPQPKPAYDVVIIGGGGHGLATAYYLAKEHGIRDVVVLERGWLGGGNTGRTMSTVNSAVAQTSSPCTTGKTTSMSSLIVLQKATRKGYPGGR